MFAAQGVGVMRVSMHEILVAGVCGLGACQAGDGATEATDTTGTTGAGASDEGAPTTGAEAGSGSDDGHGSDTGADPGSSTAVTAVETATGADSGGGTTQDGVDTGGDTDGGDTEIGGDTDVGTTGDEVPAGCAAPPLKGTILYASPDYVQKTPQQRISAMLADAAKKPIYTPPAYPMGYGPTGKQGVVRIGFDADDPPDAGANRILLTGPIAFVDNVRLEVDSGVTLVDAQTKDGTLVDWRGAPDKPLRNVTLTVGDACRGAGRRAGKFVLDRQSVLAKDLSTRFVWAENVERWLIESVHTLDHPLHVDKTPGEPGGGTGGPVVLFRGLTVETTPRLGVYRNHSNEGSAAGWGPNQIAALRDTFISHIWTDGGTALRFESSLDTPGNHGVTAEYIFGMNGNGVVSLSPHTSDSDEIHVSQVYGVSMYAGITIVKGEGGKFSKSSVTDGCIVAGKMAESPALDKPYPGSDPSQAVIYDVSGGGVTVSGIGQSGKFVGGANGDPDVPCSLAIAMGAF